MNADHLSLLLPTCILLRRCQVSPLSFPNSRLVPLPCFINSTEDNACQDMKSFTSITCLYPSDIPKKFSQMLRYPCLSLNCILIGTIILGFFVFLVTADGLGSIVNDEGIMHYDNLINAFISKCMFSVFYFHSIMLSVFYSLLENPTNSKI